MDPFYHPRARVSLMGAGRVLARALAELKALPNEAPERALALPWLVSLRIEIPADPAKRTQDDEEYIMSTESTLDTYIAQWKQEGRTEGSAQERREALVDAYTMRLGELPADMAAIIARTSDLAVLRGWHKLAVCGSAEEVAAAIRSRA